jgi:uncharacterized Zn finger protein
MPTVDDWFDEQTLMELVPIDVYVRGASAVEAGAVRIIQRDDARLLTSVEAGDDVVRAEWSLDGEQLTFACTCGDASERPCQHLIASALATWPGEMPDVDG